MMHAEPLSLEHQDLVVPRLRRLDLGLSEYSFANLYLFRHTHQYELLQGDGFYIRGVARDGYRYIMPLQTLEESSQPELFDLLSTVDGLFPIPQKWQALFPENTFQVTSWDGDSDYIYNMHKISQYPGRHLSGQRNFVKNFLRNYTPSVYPLTPERQADAHTILDHWRLGLENDEETDYLSCQEAINLWSQLQGLEGFIYYINEQPVALAIGEALTLSVYVLHFIKALKEYKGLYPYIYQQQAQRLEPQFEFLNVEQDLGNPRLAKAKNSYEPECRCTKLRISLRKTSVVSI